MAGVNIRRGSVLLDLGLVRAIRPLWIALLLLPPAVAQAQFTFTTNNGGLTITGYTGPPWAVIIPSTTNGYPVTSIGQGAFFECTRLTNVNIPDSVTSIGSSAFGSCPFLTSVTIGTNLTIIGDFAFYDCYALTSITIPDSVTSIGEGAFENCPELIITIPDSVTNIGDYAFQYCTSLSSVTIPARLTSIGNYVFHDCNHLTSVTIGTNVTSIGEGAFDYCDDLTNVTIPASVTSIGADAFGSSSDLTNITVAASNPDYTSLSGVLFDKAQVTLLQYPGGLGGSYTIPASVTRIGDDAFVGCYFLTSVTIPVSVTSIEADVFKFCDNLTSVYFQGNSPTPTKDTTVFFGDNTGTVYFLPGSTGWGSMFDGWPTALWFLPNPLILNHSPGFGVKTNQFGFTISWATNIPVVVEACTDLANSVWDPMATNMLTGGTSYFSDPQWTNFPGRFYRLRSP
jgi:hypothetical protein